MNIHDDQRYGPRPKGYKSKNTAKVPRTHNGQTYPGGRHMRRALARLAIRTANYKPTFSPSGHAMSKPGSMKVAG